MNNQLKYKSMTAYLYDVSFNQPDNDDKICLDCLNQANPWQSLRTSQHRLDKLNEAVTRKNRKAERNLETMKVQLFILSSAQQRMAIYGELYFVVEQLKPLRQQIASLEKTIKRLKRINRNQRNLLKDLKCKLLGARGVVAQTEVKNQIEDIELELMSLWQRCIGAELDRIRLIEQSLECKEQAAKLLDEQLTRYCRPSQSNTA